jgi:hypothetical protein
MTAWVDTLNTGDAKQAVTDAFTNTLNLAESCLTLSDAAGGRPTDLPEGGSWVDPNDPSFSAHMVYADLEGTGAADYEVGQVHHAKQQMLGALRADKVIEGLCVQRLAAHPAPAATNVGEIYELTGDGRLYVVVDLGAGSYSRRNLVAAGATDFAVQYTTAGDWLPDLTNPPTLAEKGNAAGWKFTATNQKLKLRTRAPLGWDSDFPPEVRIEAVLDATGAAGDNIHWRIGYKARTPNAGALANAALTNADVDQDLAASFNEYEHVEATVELDETLIVAGQEVLLVLSVPTYGGAGNVGARIFTGADIRWPVGTGLTE